MVAQAASGFASLRQRKRWIEALLATQQPLGAAEATALAQRKPLIRFIVPPALVEMLPPGAASL